MFSYAAIVIICINEDKLLQICATWKPTVVKPVETKPFVNQSLDIYSSKYFPYNSLNNVAGLNMLAGSHPSP